MGKFAPFPFEGEHATFIDSSKSSNNDNSNVFPHHQGINKWIPLVDIQTRNFGDETGEFLLELSLGNIMTIFEASLNLPGTGASNSAPSVASHGSGGTPISFKNGKIETSYFHFGTFEWNISIVMHNTYGSGAANMVRTLFKDKDESDFLHRADKDPSSRSYLVYLNRLTGFENSCCIQYRIVLGQGQSREDTGILEQMSDTNGRSRGYQIDYSSFGNLISSGSLQLYFEFYSCNPVSEAKVPITRNLSPTINCYDRNQQVSKPQYS